MSTQRAYSAKDMGGHPIHEVGAPVEDNDASRKVDVEDAYAAAISRANHTGSQPSSTISDFDSQVRSSRLDQMASPTNPVSMNNQRLTSLGNGTDASDAVNKGQLDAALAALAEGSRPKGAVKVVVQTNVNLAAPGANLDGVAMANGDVFWANAQTTGSQNGPYVYNGAAAAATRAPNWDTNAEAVLGSFWIVLQGTSADGIAVLTNDTAINLGTSTPVVTVRGLNAAVTAYAANCPVVAAGGSWTVPHNLGSEDVTVQVRRVASPKDFIDVYIKVVDINNVAVEPDEAFAADEFRVIVKR